MRARRVRGRVTGNLSLSAGIALIAALAVLAASLPAVLQRPGEQVLTELLVAPSAGHPFGTDYLGRDQLSRVAEGARTSLVVATVVAVVSGLGGGLVGLFSIRSGRMWDIVIQRVVDGTMALPLIVLALAAIAAFGTGFWTVTAAISVSFAPLSIRVARAAGMVTVHSEYVAYARVCGASPVRMVFRHLLPAAAAPVAIIAAAQAGGAVLAEGALGFIGLGVGGRLSLGALLGGEAQAYIYEAPWLMIWPGLALMALAATANLVADGISNWSAKLPAR